MAQVKGQYVEVTRGHLFMFEIVINDNLMTYWQSKAIADVG